MKFQHNVCEQNTLECLIIVRWQLTFFKYTVPAYSNDKIVIEQCISFLHIGLVNRNRYLSKI